MAPLQAEARAFLAKATQNLEAAESDYAVGRYDACANRAYYSCFQAAIAALLVEGIRPPGRPERWGHDFVQAQFAGVLVGQRYAAGLRTTLPGNRLIRDKGDYTRAPVAHQEASRALRQARVFVAAVEEQMPWQRTSSG